MKNFRLKWKMLISRCLILCLLISLISVGMPTKAADYTYDAEAAVAYAKAHWNESGFCTNFVSDCLEAGGLTALANFAQCHKLVAALENLGISQSVLTVVNNKVPYSRNEGRVAAGDPVFWHCTTCEQYTHTALCGEANADGNVTYYAHNDPAGGAALIPWLCPKSHMMELVAFHITPSTPTGLLHADFYKDNVTWSNPNVAGCYVKNTATGQIYSMRQDASYDYAYHTTQEVPYGEYELYVPSGTGVMTLYGSMTLEKANAWYYLWYFTVGYDGNGATGGTTPATQVVLENYTMKLPQEDVFAKNGYSFCYWRNTLNEDMRTGGRDYKVTGTQTIYAYWYPGEYRLGDVDYDHTLTSTDARLIEQYYVNKIDSIDPLLADYDQDGEVTATDARLVLQVYAGKMMLEPGVEVMSNGRRVTYDDLNWDLLDWDALDWENFSLQALVNMLTADQPGAGHEVM